jgi:hypothetical protein
LNRNRFYELGARIVYVTRFYYGSNGYNLGAGPGTRSSALTAIRSSFGGMNRPFHVF